MTHSDLEDDLAMHFRAHFWRGRAAIVLVLTLCAVLATSTRSLSAGLPPITATTVYGQGGSFTANSQNNGGVTANSLSGPTSVAVDSAGGLYVADGFNSRVLFFPSGSTTATRVYGQSGSLTSNTPNNGGVSANSLSAHVDGVALDHSDNLYVADSSNNRVLYYPSGSTTATRVYGQGGSFTSNTPNNGGLSADSLSLPTSVAVDSNGNVYVADFGNFRALMYPAGSTTASQVYGQGGSFFTNIQDKGGVSADSLGGPWGVAVDATGGVYVSDYGSGTHNRVLFYPEGSTTATRVYGQGGSFTANVQNNGGISAASLAAPTGLALDGSGNLYVADGNNRVLVYTGGSTTASQVYGENGSFTTASNGGVTANTLSSPTGAAVDASGNLFVADSVNNRVLEYRNSASATPTPSATVTLSVLPETVWGQASFTSNSTGTTAAAMQHPSAVAVDGSGNTYVADLNNNRVLVFAGGSANGAAAVKVYGQQDFTSSGCGCFGTTSATTMWLPDAVAVDSAGNLFVADENNNRVLMFAAGSPSGAAATKVYGQQDFSSNGAGTSASSLSQPAGVAVDSSGNLFVSEVGNNRVVMFAAGAPSGAAATKVYGQPDFTSSAGGATASTLRFPQGIAVDSAGNLYVTDLQNSRVLVFPAGAASGAAATRVLGQPDFTSSGFTTTTAWSVGTPSGVAVDGAGNVYVADYIDNRVLLFRAGAGNGASAAKEFGNATFTSQSGGTSASAMSQPYGVALDSAGNLYVAEFTNNRVLINPPAVLNTPSVTALNPNAGLTSGGTTVTITGANFGSATNGSAATAVLFGTTAATSFSVTSSTSIMATSPAGAAGTVHITVTTPFGTSATASGDQFTYAAPPPAASAVYGQPDFAHNTSNNGGVSASSLGSPRGVAADASGNLYVSDFTDNRVLFYPAGQTTATRVYGQPDLSSSTANNGGVSASSLSSPRGLTLDASGNLYVADGNNNRVLFYPAGQTTATKVWGQPDLTSNSANNGGLSASSLSSPRAVAVDAAGNVRVSDGGNNRVLVFPAGQSAASVVYGQPGFTTGTANNGGVSASSLSSPGGLTTDSSGNLYVADSSNNRVLYFPSGQTAATKVWGQPDLVSRLSNNGGLSASSLLIPNGLLLDSTGDLYVADGSNNRVLFFPAGQTTATKVWGQPVFTVSTANNGGISASSLFTPNALAFDVSGNLFVSETSNNRVLKFGSASASPASVSFAPASAQPGGTITATGSGFGSGATITVTINTSPVTTLGTCTADSSGNIANCGITLPLSLGAGSYTITVSDGSGHTATSSFTVAKGPPPLAVVGKAGTSFTLKGGNFDKSTVPSVVFTPVNGGSATTVNTACASGQKIGCIQKTSTTSIAVKAPSGPSGLQQVTVTGVDVLSFSLYFDYGPAIQSISKASGDGGVAITIKGGNFGTSKTSAPTITFGTGTINAKCGKTLKTGCITSASDKSISFKTPTSGSGANTIKVTTAGGSVADDLTRLGAAFTYDGAITNVKPAVGAGGSTVQIQGVNFGKGKASLTVAFGSTTLASSCGSGATGCVKSHSDTSITVIAPSGLSGTQAITVTNDDGNTADDRTITGASFDYNPAITSISPQAGPAAKTTIKISGANFTTSLPTVTIGTSRISAKCSKTVKTGCFTSTSDKTVSIKPPTTLTGMQTIAMTVGGVTADNLTGGDLVFDFGAAITTEK